MPGPAAGDDRDAARQAAHQTPAVIGPGVVAAGSNAVNSMITSAGEQGCQPARDARPGPFRVNVPSH